MIQQCFVYNIMGAKGLTLKKSDIRSSKYAVQVVAYDMFGNEFKSDVSIFDNE